MRARANRPGEPPDTYWYFLVFSETYLNLLVLIRTYWYLLVFIGAY